MTENTFDKKIQEEGAKTLFQVVWSVFEKLGKKAVDRIKIEGALQEYTSNYIKRHGSIKVLGMPDPISLVDIYTNVRIINPDYRNRLVEIELLEEKFRYSRTYHAHHETKNGIDVANQKQKLNILGAPGSGKSTFLKRIGISALLKDNLAGAMYAHNCIPVLIELKRFRNEPINLVQLLQNEFEIAGFPESSLFVDTALKNGELLILLDGIDEVPNAVFEETINHLKDFIDKHDKNRFITSCRTAFYKSFLKSFSDIEIANFDDHQIKQFIQNWFSLGEDKLSNASGRLLELLFSKENASTLELARTPLLLTFLCLTFDDSQKFPANRSSLYKRALMILMEKWAAEKRIHNEDIYQDLNSDLELEMLSEIAAKFYKDNKYFFFQHEIKNAISSFLNDSLNLKNIHYSKIIDAIEIQQGLLIQRAPDIYSFSHLTIQEYLTANYFFSPTRTYELVNNYLFDSRWREVFLLSAGMSEDVLLVMNNHLQSIAVQNLLLKRLGDWFIHKFRQTGNFEIDVSRRLYIAHLIISYAYYDKHVAPIDSFSHILNSIDKEFLRSFKIQSQYSKRNLLEIGYFISEWQSEKEKTSYTISINHIDGNVGFKSKAINSDYANLFKLIQMPKNIYSPTYNEFQFFLKYLEACSLLIDCKKGALRTSKSTWRKICTSILAN